MNDFKLGFKGTNYNWPISIHQQIAFIKLPVEGLDQGHLHPLHRASETEASQSGIEPGTSCTADEHSMQRAIQTALLTVLRNLNLHYYSSPPSKMRCCKLLIGNHG
jgi:hypothetical protein